MESSVADNMLSQFENLNCPFVCDVDASYLSELLLSPSQHRTRILSWLLSKTDVDIQNEIEAFCQSSVGVASSAEVDKETQLLTSIAASLGLCCPTDFLLIKGKSCMEKQVALWRNLLTIAAVLSNDNGHLKESMETIDQVMDGILRTCDVLSSLSKSLHILPPALEKDLNISLKTGKFSNSKWKSLRPDPKIYDLKEMIGIFRGLLLSQPTASTLSTTELCDKMEVLQKELQGQTTILEDLRKSNPNLSLSADDPSSLETINRSLSVTSTDLAHLQTSFLQTFDNHFEPYCDKKPIEFTQLGDAIHGVDKRLSSLLALFDSLKTLKEVHHDITKNEFLT